MYNEAMTVTASDFRKNLFQLVERALNGERIEITFRSRTVRLTPLEPSSKLSRLITRDTLTCSPDEFEKTSQNQDEEISRQWEDKWRNRL